MSKSSRPKKNSSHNEDEPTPEQRRKQILLGLAMGAVMGIVISALTTFWYWLPAGLALGLATGVIMKPPAK